MTDSVTPKLPNKAPSLPARVRVTCPPLPLAPALAQAVAKLLPAVKVADAEAAALAIAGGSVIGAALQIQAESPLAVTPTWRGKGIEEALVKVLAEV